MSTDTTTTTGLMTGKRGLIMGVANERSIPGASPRLWRRPAPLAFTYQTERFPPRQPLAESVGSDFTLSCDVVDDDDLDRVFAAIEDRWPALDFVVHAIAYSVMNG